MFLNCRFFSQRIQVRQHLEGEPRIEGQATKRERVSSKQETPEFEPYIIAGLERLYTQAVLKKYPGITVENFLYLGQTENGRAYFTFDTIERKGRKITTRYNVLFDDQGDEVSFGQMANNTFDGIDHLLMVASNSNNPKQQARAIDCLRYFGNKPDVRKTVRDALRSPHENVRAEAIMVLAYLRDREAIPDLGSFVKTGSPLESARACYALGNIGDPAAVSFLLDALPAAEGIMRNYIVNALNICADRINTRLLIEQYQKLPDNSSYKDSLALVLVAQVKINEVTPDFVRGLAKRELVRTALSADISEILDSGDFFIQIRSMRGLSIANAFSIAIATSRLLERQRNESREENLLIALDAVLQARYRFSDAEIFGRDRNVIIFTHEKDVISPFENETFTDIALRAGVPQEQIQNFKGPEGKSAILESIRNSRGPTTIVFFGHGEKDRIFLAENTFITVNEIAQELTRSNNARNVTLIFYSCYSYDFAQNIIDALNAESTPIPQMVSIATKDRPGNVGFSQSLERVSLHKKLGDPLKGKDLFSVESRTFTYQDDLGTGTDMGFFISDEDQPFYFGNQPVRWLEISKNEEKITDQNLA